MKKEFIITVLCFVFMFFGGAFSLAAKAETFYVNDSGDGPVRNGSCINSGGCTLREAVQRARNNDTIRFASPYFDTARTIKLTQGTPLFNNNGGTLDIYGNGANMLTIDGNNTQIFSVSRVSYVYSTLYLHQMTLANGRQNSVGAGGGGAITVLDSDLNMDQVVITNCTSAYFGGAIYTDGGNIRIQHSTLYNNYAAAYGSAIYSRNTASNKTLLEITDTTISGNSSPNAQGAAIYSLQTEMHILFTTITKNSANSGNSAGGIFIDTSCNSAGGCQSYLDVNSSIIAENPNVGSPNISGTINVQANSLLGGNPLLLPLASNLPRVSTVRGLPTHALDTCSPAINAGAVPPGVTSDEQYDPRVLQGRADIGAYESFLLPCPSAVTVTNGNDSGGGSLRQAISDIAPGGTIDFASGVSDIVLTSGEISINRDMNVGGDGTNQVTVHGNDQSRIFTVSGGKTVNLSKIVLADGNAGSAGGGAINNYGTLNITSSAIVNNKAQDAGGGIYNNGTLTLTNSTVSGNESYGKGAGIYNNGYGGYSGNVTLLNSTVTNNHNVAYTGAGVWNDNGTFSARNSIIDGNFSDQNYAQDYVGGLTNQGYNLIGTRNPQLAPLANNGGATLTHALLCTSAAVDTGDPNNIVATDQRGIARPYGSRVDIGAYEINQPCSIAVTSGNSTGNGTLRQAISDLADGGTITFASGISTIRFSGGTISIYKNITINGAGAVTLISGGFASILYIYNGVTANLNGINFAGGTVTSGNGGAIQNYGTLNLTNSAISGITASNSGGGIYNSGTLNASFINVSGNQAGIGGGIANNATMNLTNSTLSGNTGDGIFNGGNATLLSSTVSGNNGGGILNSGVLSLLNSTVSGNQTNGKGAGIYNNGGSNILATIVNSTITDNRGFGYTGAGVWNDNGGDTFRVRNSIIDGNFSDQGYAHDYVGGLTNQGNNLIGTRNPGLAPLGNYGGATQTHALLQTSPALDAGNNCILTANGCADNNPALTTDQRGASVSRKVGAAVDIGAFERNIAFEQSTLSNGSIGTSYNQTLSVSRQSNSAQSGLDEQISAKPAAPFTFTIVPIAGQQLPPGLSLASDGTISGMPTTGGTFTFTVKTIDQADGTAGVQQFIIQIAAPTAATVSISGKVFTPEGRGLTNATIVLTDAAGNQQTTRTTTFGNYHFENIAAGRTYVLTVVSKRYQFAPQVVTATEDLTNLDFTAQQ